MNKILAFFIERKPKKSYSVPKICDLYLKALHKERNKKAPFLNSVLEEKRVYYDYKILDEVITKLTEQKLIKEIPDTLSVISFSKKIDFFDAIEKAEGMINQYELTDKGEHFVENKQEIDVEGVAKRKQQIEKWKDKAIGFIIGVASSGAGVLIKSLLD